MSDQHCAPFGVCARAHAYVCRCACVSIDCECLYTVPLNTYTIAPEMVSENVKKFSFREDQQSEGPEEHAEEVKTQSDT